MVEEILTRRAAIPIRPVAVTLTAPETDGVEVAPVTEAAAPVTEAADRVTAVEVRSFFDDEKRKLSKLKRLIFGQIPKISLFNVLVECDC